MILSISMREALEIIERELINAYTNLSRDPEKMKLAQELVREYKWISIEQALRYIELLGDEAEELLNTQEDEIMKTIRVNTLITLVDRLQRRLETKNFVLEKHPFISYGLIVKKAPYSIGATLEYLLGLYTIQGPASMTVVPVLAPENISDGTIVDLCAGAGIKTTQIAQHNPLAPILAFDINRRKLLALKNNASRLGTHNIIALRDDARNISSYGTFKAILLDAPCSGEGLLPFKKGRWPRSFNDIISRVKLQFQLINAALNALERDGVIVYSTCSISVEENEYVVSLASRLRGDLTIEKPPLQIPVNGVTSYLGLKLVEDTRNCVRFLPHKHKTEGFTICRLRKL